MLFFIYSFFTKLLFPLLGWNGRNIFTLHNFAYFTVNVFSCFLHFLEFYFSVTYSIVSFIYICYDKFIHFLGIYSFIFTFLTFVAFPCSSKSLVVFSFHFPLVCVCFLCVRVCVCVCVCVRACVRVCVCVFNISFCFFLSFPFFSFLWLKESCVASGSHCGFITYCIFSVLFFIIFSLLQAFKQLRKEGKV